MKKAKRRIPRISELETLEEKSFWLVSIIIIVLGAVSLLTSDYYNSFITMLMSIILFVVVPVGLVFIVKKSKSYHVAYPLLCSIVGGLSVPLMFIVGGGFFSGMGMFCVVLTGITALCYSRKFRYISFAICIAGTTLSFLYVFLAGAAYLEPVIDDVRFPIIGTDSLYSDMKAVYAVYRDMVFSYYCASAGIFAVINFTTNDIRKYKFNQDTLQRFFDREKRKEILDNALKSDISKAPHHQNVAVLFADISNFTATTEKMPSELIMEYLNEFFTTLSTYVHNSNGIIDKFIGDGAMIYWVDQEDQNCVLNAVQAVLDTRKDLLGRMETIFAKYGTELNFSAGIAYGDVIFGDIGSDSMHDYTIIGDAVNTASRIESLASSGETLVSNSALQFIKDEVDFESIKSDWFLKGKNKPIDIYTITGLSEGKKQEKQLPNKVENGYSLFVCGCRGSFPVSGLRFSEYGGETSCYIIKKGDYAIVVDCGTGLKNAINIIGNCKKIDFLLTHVHYDHILGLLISKFPADAELRIFGQFEVWNKSNPSFKNFMDHPCWPVKIIDMEKNDVKMGLEIQLRENVAATFYPSDHPDDACVIKLMCGDKKIVFLGDCENANIIDASISENAEILFFDGMFDDENIEMHRGWGHGTWQDGTRFAQERNIKKLVITHHNPESGDLSLKEKETAARSIAPNVSFAKSGDIFTF